MVHSENRILASLPNSEAKVLEPILKGVLLEQHTTLFDSREEIDTVFFPFDAVVSLVVPLASGGSVETALVGRDGALGAQAVLGGRISFNRAVVQLGGSASACSVEAIKAILEQCPTLKALLAKHEQVLFSHSQQLAACNVSHDLESRLARWLLRARDLRSSDDLDLTQEYLAEILGVRRSSVSLIAHTIQRSGAIAYKRGHIRLLNVDALKEMSCECYEAVKLNYDTLLPQTTK
jgi:CRP-like cAMP-binding protein